MRCEKLQLKLLSKNGQLLNVVNCFAGQVTVFRAASDSDLAPYQRALSGVPGPEKFLILLDNQGFNPEEHTLVGFGERFVESDGLVEEFLASSGIQAAAAGPLLTSYGLERVRDRHCSELSEDLEHRLRLLAAVHTPGKVMVLNNPFEPIASQWKERFAELIVSSARTKEQIVVVPRLSYRPQCWIDNEFIARVQVGENIQKTIGFGAQGGDMNDLVKRLREEYKSASAPQAAPPPPEKSAAPPVERPRVERRPVQNTSPSAVETPRASVRVSKTPTAVRDEADVPGVSLRNHPALRWLFELTPRAQLGLAGALLVILAVVPLLIPRDGSVPAASDHTQSRDHSAPVEVAVHQKQDAPALQPPPPPPAGQAPGDAPLPPSPDPERFGPVLARYPQPVQEAVMASFEGRLVASSAILRRPQPLPLVSGEAREERDKSRSNLFALLEAASGPEQNSPGSNSFSTAPSFPVPPSHIDPNMDPEAKRELIHQKFLEAIRRASERRVDEGM